MKTIALFIFIGIVTVPAVAAEPTLNDLPSILMKLRGCTTTTLHSLLGGRNVVTTCRIAKRDLWASVDLSGHLTLFRQRSWGDNTYADGDTVTELLRDFASKINEERETQKIMLDAMAPYLPSQ